jgi:hypothetical protein
MIERLKARPTLAALAAAAVTALGVGGVAVAQSGDTSPANNTPARAQPAQQEKAPESEQSVPENSAVDPDNVQDENGKDDATEASERGEGPEKAEAPGQEAREVPNDDGPGGHADEPANPNADHQFQGVE